MYCLKTDDPFVQIPIKAMKIPSECDKQTPRSSPTMQGGGVEGGRWGGPPPTTHRGPTLCRGWASVHGGQTPISPQVLTKDSKPPPLCHQCTAATFLGLTNTCGNRNGLPPTPHLMLNSSLTHDNYIWKSVFL